MKYLVFGGTQFVSNYIVKRLIEDGHEIKTLTRGNKKNTHGSSVKELYADRCNFEQLSSVLENIDIDYVIDVSGYNKTDVSSSYEALKNKNIKGYIFISSGSVYVENNELPLYENSKTGVNKYWGSYGTDKLEAENFLINKFKETSFPVVILRPPYIYGEGNNVYRESYIFDRLKSNEKILLPKKGNTIIQFIHIEDLYRIVLKVIEKNITGEIFNVANENTITFKEWVKSCMEAYGKTVDLINFDYTDSEYTSRDFFPFFDYDYYLDISKLLEIYKPEIKFEYGLKKSLQWYLQNEDKVDKRDRYSKNINTIVKSL